MNKYVKGRLVFPVDEGDKNTPFDWWYLTSHFTTSSGKKFSYTVVYISTDPNRCIRQTSLTNNEGESYFWELISGVLNSEKGLLDLKFSNKNGDKDYWRQKEGELFNYSLLTSIGSHTKLEISLESNKPPLIHNDGLIMMGRGGQSFYYSLTNLSLNGTFFHDGVAEKVHGIAWIDRQWGSWDPKGYDGWEWFALQLNDNTEIMLYVFYDLLKESRISCVLSLMFSDGHSVTFEDPELFQLTNLDYWEIKRSKKRLQGFPKCCFSSGWRLSVPRYKIDLIITPIFKKQRIGNFSWEGSCHVVGTHNNVTIDSISTVELTHLYVYPNQIRLIKNMFKLFNPFTPKAVSIVKAKLFEKL